MLLGNTTAGNLTTGNAAIVASEINMLQSSNNFGSGGQPVVFTTNIDGNVNGDFLLDPATLSNVQPASTNSSTNALNNNLTINNTTNATLTNNLNLNAASGNATADANTTAGNVTTGNANAVANVINTINSAISAGKSFVGVININGNLNGDILLPPDFVNQLLAANVPTVNITGPGSTNTSNTTVNNTTNVSNTTNQGINNNVNATASSGSATASGNTTAGNVTTGNASTNITAFNLTDSKVIGSNDLLVFVNVLGKWVGLIVNAPAGTSAAELGGGIISTGPDSTNTSNTSVNNTANINNNTTQQINNNVNVNAASGDAAATRNTTVGDVTSGNAKAAVNLLNVENSTLTLSNWFGVLFINVFGTWNGSFGVNTAAGDMPGSFSQTMNGNSAGSSNADSKVPAGFQVFRFAPSSSGSGSNASGSQQNSTGSGQGDGSKTTTGTILAAAHIAALDAAPKPQLANTHNNLTKVDIAVALLVVGYIGADLAYSRRHSDHS